MLFVFLFHDFSVHYIILATFQFWLFEQIKKTRHSSSKHERSLSTLTKKGHRHTKAVRSCYDMPTTEPEFDLAHFNSSDEELTGGKGGGNAQAELDSIELHHSKTFKNIVRTSERHEQQQHTVVPPPELIITSAKCSSSPEHGDAPTNFDEVISRYHAQKNISELPPIEGRCSYPLEGGSANNIHKQSWHKSKRCIPKLR